MKLPHQPHDKFFKASLKERQIAVDFLRAHLPVEIYQRLDLSTLQLTDKSLSLPELKEMHGDIVYRCQIDGQEGYIPILFLLEHLSTAPEHTAFYLLQGSIGLMADHLKAGHDKLPLVLPICLYHGKKSPYPRSTNLYDAFDDPALAQALMFKPFHLVDLTVLPEETLQQHGTAGLMELLFKQYHTKYFLQALKQAADSRLLQWTVTHTTAPYFVTVLQYVYSTGHPQQSVEELSQVLTQALPDKQEVIMSFAQQLEKRGFEKGKQHGMKANHQEVWQAAQQQGMQASHQEVWQAAQQQGMQASHQEVWQAAQRYHQVETAKKLLAKKAEMALIKAATGLTDTELAKIAKDPEE